MQTYAPLVFVDNIKNFFYDTNLSTDIFEDITKLDYLERALDLKYTTYEGGNIRDEKYSNVINSLRKYVSKKYNINQLDRMDELYVEAYLISAFIASAWRKNKISYKIDKELLSQFYSMDIPKELSAQFMLKQPSNSYYLDISEYGDEILKGAHGMFISTKEIEEYIIIRIILYAPGIYKGDTTILHLRVNKNKQELTIPKFKTESCEDLDGLKLYKVLLNFMVYLHASNKDVEISERTRQNHTKKDSNVIKDKFREVKEFSVGLRYGNEVRKNKVRYKYIGESESTGEHRKVTSHYRAAHWHRYWVGTGDNKELVPKWIEGVFVKGSVESDDIVIHKVK